MRPLTFAFGVLLFLTAPAPAAGPAPRNVVLLIADDLGFQLGCYGDRHARTPNIDGLANDGVRFTHAFAAVSSCSPSRAVLLTGLHTHQNGQYGLAHAVHNQHTFATVKSLPRLLRGAGYRTGIIGKVHVQPAQVYPFDAVITQGLGGNRNVAAMAEKARQFFADAGDRPFLLVVGFSDPHRAAKGFATERPFKGVPEQKYDPKELTVPYFLSDRPEVRQELTEYYQAVSRLDHGIGLIREALRQAKKSEDTLVIFVSDNGPPFPGAKTTLYDAGVHLPLIVSAPGQKRRGSDNDALVSWVDVAPTVLDWAGVKPPAEVTGRSLLPILGEEHPAGWDTVYGSHQFHEITMYYPMRMVRTRHHKYLRNLAHALPYPFASDLYNSQTWQGVLRRGDEKMGDRSVSAFVHRPLEELYDLDKDPHELHNVAGDAKYADVLADLRARLKDWQQRTRDPWLVKYKYE